MLKTDITFVLESEKQNLGNSFGIFRWISLLPVQPNWPAFRSDPLMVFALKYGNVLPRAESLSPLCKVLYSVSSSTVVVSIL